MTTDTETLYRPVAARVAEMKAEERRQAREERRAKDAALERRAEQEIAREQAAEDKALAARKADSVEASLRPHAPYVEIHTGTGKVVRVDISRGEPVLRGTAQEGVRRCIWKAAEAHLHRVAASRAALAVLPAEDFVTGMLDADAGLRHAAKAGLVSVRNEDH